MLTTQFDLTIALFATLGDVVPEEVAQADIVEIRGKVSGGIYHPKSMNWRGSLLGISDPLKFIRSKKERKSIQSNIQYFEDDGYVFKTVELTQALYNEFLDLYHATTLKRERALSLDLHEQIWAKVAIGNPVYLIGMFKKDKLESGLVFSVNKQQEALVSFGAKKKFTKKRGGVGGVFEFFLLQFCLEHNIQEISHGRSTNPAGLMGKIGIFEFKARYGFTAFPERYWVTTFIKDPKKVGLSDLLFVTIIDNEVGYLIVSDEERQEIVKKYQTKEVKNLKVLPTKTVISSYEMFLKSL